MAGPGQRYVHLIDDELTRDAQYRSFSAIPSHAINWGTVIQFLPGTYEMGTIRDMDNVTFEGVGAPQDVILANVVLANTTANTVIFRNLTLSGNSAAVGSTGRSILIEDGATGTVRFREVLFTTGDFGIDNRGRANFLVVDSCQFTTDKAIRSNSTVSANIWYSILNATSNAYFSTFTNDAARPFRVVASTSGGSNSGNSVRTVSALIT